MPAEKMHADEVDTDVSLVRRLLAAQFPRWADLTLERVASSGTDNALYRLGDDLVVRLPRIHWAVGGVHKDVRWLPRLSPLLPVSIPVPLAKGEPAEGWSSPPVWVHSDVLPGNLLVQGGRLTGVIDFSGMGVGDPACDLMIAWALFSGESREAFRAALTVDDATWARGRGHALSQALVFVPYYLHTNPVGVRTARRAIDEVLADRSL